MARHVYVREVPDQSREVEVKPFPIGEGPAGNAALPVDQAELILRPASVPYEFRTGPHATPVARAARLETFVEAIRDAPVETLEWGLHGRSMQQWVGDVLGDETLRRELEGIKALSRYGEPLRTILYATAKSRLAELTVR